MLLYYIRHGEPIYNPDMLTDLGVKQAEALAKRLAIHGVDKIYASTSNRAIMTAKPTAELLNKEITTLDFCNESHAWSYFTVKTPNGGKEWCFQNADMIKCFSSNEITSLGKGWYEHSCFSDTNFKEGFEIVSQKADEFLTSLGFKHNADGTYDVLRKNNPDRIALFAHAGFGSVFLSSILDIPYPSFCTHFSFGHSGMTVIHFDSTKDKAIPNVLTHSNDAHLYKEKILTKYNNVFSF